MSASRPPTSTGGTDSEDPRGPRSVPPSESEIDLEIEVSPEDRRRAGEALRASFARLSPQGSDEWNFMGAFTLLGDRFGPYQPGASDLADVLGGAKERSAARRSPGRLGRLRAGGAASATGDQGEKSDFDEAMGHIIEAFRFLHARVSTLEARLHSEDVPLDGAAWLAPARELGTWVEPIAAFVRERTPGGEVLHADCGEGSLLLALAKTGTPARGVEPRGGVALSALEHGCEVSISEAAEYLGSCGEALLGAVVLSGVVDRIPLHSIITLLGHTRRALAPGAPLVVVSDVPPDPAHSQPSVVDLVDHRFLHSQTWGLLLERNGFEQVGGLAGPAADTTDARFAVAAIAPAT